MKIRLFHHLIPVFDQEHLAHISGTKCFPNRDWGRENMNSEKFMKKKRYLSPIFGTIFSQKFGNTQFHMSFS